MIVDEEEEEKIKGKWETLYFLGEKGPVIFRRFPAIPGLLDKDGVSKYASVVTSKSLK
jgi:hypothetical protein